MRVVARAASALTVLASLALVGCGNVSPRVPVQVQAAHGRFVVSLTHQVVNEASGHHLDLRSLASTDLTVINSILPGPSTEVTLTVGDPDQISFAIGAAEFTDPETGAITIGLYPSWSEEPWNVSQELARTLARGVVRSVRITSGAGLGKTILDEMVAAGIATAFGESAFPGPPDPWVNSLTAKQECQQWRHLHRLLHTVGIHQEVLTGGDVSAATFGESSMPPFTGQTIGYHIVADYLARTGKSSWSALAATPAQKIYAGSGYAPCQLS